MPSEEFRHQLDVLEHLFVNWEGDIRRIYRYRSLWDPCLLVRCQVISELYRDVGRLDQEHVWVVHLLLASCMLCHQVAHMATWECYCALGLLIDELTALGPVVLSVRVPVGRQLQYFEHAEGTLLLQFIVYVEESTHKSIVSHWVGNALSDQTKVECLVPAANTIVLVSQVDMPDVDAEVFDDDGCHALDEARLLLLYLLVGLSHGILYLFLKKKAQVSQTNRK